TGSGHIMLWHINVLSLITSSLQVLGSPARQAIVPSLIPPGLLLNAVTLTTIMQQGTQLTGPVLAGYLIDFVGLDKAYYCDAALIVPSIVCVFLIKSSGQPHGGRRRTGRSLCRTRHRGYDWLSPRARRRKSQTPGRGRRDRHWWFRFRIGLFGFVEAIFGGAHRGWSARLQRRHQRRHTAYYGSIPGARSDAWPGFELSDCLRSDDKRPRCRNRRRRRGTRGGI